MTQIRLKLKPTEGALLRVIGVTERRGYPLLQIDAQTAEDHMVVSLGVKNTRPIPLLLKQLNKLHDVYQAEVLV